MRSDQRRPGLARALALALALGATAGVLAQNPRTTPRFRLEDPVRVDPDTRYDAANVREQELSETWDFLKNQLGKPGDRRPIKALNVNTLGEVPDSSWFTNRIGVRGLSAARLRRGPNKFDTDDARSWDTWVVTQGKGSGGFHPGFRAERPGDPGQVYQLEVDPIGYPRLATGAEIIGTLIYHALGYHVQDTYLIRVHPSKLSMAPKATIRDAAGRRPYTRHDLDNILRHAARDADGRVYMSASRYEEGADVGQFEYHGVRADDPNDVIPHEHRRELRANRVFGAWLAHDDSRAVNTRNIRKRRDGQEYVEHFMHDFGAILGSATRFPDAPTTNHFYFLEGRSSLVALGTLGLRLPRALTARTPRDIPPSVGWFESESFDPPGWKPNYPNVAFANMQPEDAFWGARLVSRFSDDALRTIVSAGDYDDPAAVEYLVGALARRRDLIARAWLTPMTPVVRPRLSANGTLTFDNAAVDAKVASHGEYVVAWAQFDNDTGALGAASTTSAGEPRLEAPAGLLADARFVRAAITVRHAEFPAWALPVHVYFRRVGDRWTTVGIDRAATVRR